LTRTVPDGEELEAFVVEFAELRSARLDKIGSPIPRRSQEGERELNHFHSVPNGFFRYPDGADRSVRSVQGRVNRKRRRVEIASPTCSNSLEGIFDHADANLGLVA